MTVVLFCVVLIAATLHALWNFAAKKVAGDLSTMWLGVCLATVLSWPCALLLYDAATSWHTLLFYVCATGILHAWYFALLAKAYALGEISVVYPVARGTGVAGTALVAWLWLHDTISWPGLLGICAICTGTALVGYSVSGQREHFLAYVQAVLVGGIITGYSIVDKQAVGAVHPVVYISGMFTITAGLLAPYVLHYKRAACVYAMRHLRGYIGLIGIGAIGTYLIILFAFRFGPVSYIVATREFAVVVGALLGVLILKEPLSPRKALGIMAITLGLILVKLA
jgi:drug/metabolite transporter (DMT)-like permease